MEEEEQSPLDTSETLPHSREGASEESNDSVTTGTAISQIRLGRCDHYNTVC